MVVIVELILAAMVILPTSFFVARYTENAFWCLVIPSLSAYYISIRTYNSSRNKRSVGLKAVVYGIISFVFLITLSYGAFQKGIAAEALTNVLMRMSSEQEKIDITKLKGDADFYMFAIEQGYRIKPDEGKLVIVKKTKAE